jgi:hypothetical protein
MKRNQIKQQEVTLMANELRLEGWLLEVSTVKSGSKRYVWKCTTNHDWWIGTPVHHSYEKCTRRAYGLMQESRERTLPMGAVRWTSNPSPTGRLLHRPLNIQRIKP